MQYRAKINPYLKLSRRRFFGFGDSSVPVESPPFMIPVDRRRASACLPLTRGSQFSLSTSSLATTILAAAKRNDVDDDDSSRSLPTRKSARRRRHLGAANSPPNRVSQKARRMERFEKHTGNVTVLQ